MLSPGAATTSAERFAFYPLGDLVQADREPWMECLKAFLAATQLLDQDPAEALQILEALAEAPLLRYLCWTCSADPEPLMQFSNEQAFVLETREAIQYQAQEFLQAAANDLGAGPIAQHQIQVYWKQHQHMILSTFQRLCVLSGRAAQALRDDEQREHWAHRALMASVIFGIPLTDELQQLAEGDEWRVGERPVALRFARRWEALTGPSMRLSQA